MSARNWIMIPVKAPDACKTRLRGVLTGADRQRLVADMPLLADPIRR